MGVGRGGGQGLLFSTCFLREKQQARKEKMRETEDMIATREVQGLMDNVGEPSALSPKGRPVLGMMSPDGRVCCGSTSEAPAVLTGVLCSASQRMSFGHPPGGRASGCCTVGNPRKEGAHYCV